MNFIRFCQEHRLAMAAAGEHHHARPGWIQTHCPQCTDGTHGFHLGFNIHKGYLNCWRCAKVRDADFIRDILKVSQEEAWRILREFSDGQGSTEGVKRVAKRRRKLKDPPGLGPMKGVHRAYLRARGFSPKKLERLWELRGTGQEGGAMWGWRVCFPIKNAEGITVAWGGRHIGEDKRKYRVTEDEKCLEDPRGFLYGIHKAEGSSVLVVEGPTGVWRFGPGTVGTLGISWREEQAEKLRRFENRFIMFDPEELAQKRARKLATWLSIFPGNTEIIGGLSCQPGDIAQRRAKAIRRELLGGVR